MRFILFIILYILLITGCKNQQNLISPPSGNEQVNYRVIYLIHADANYLYHDEDGNAIQADEKVKAEAKRVGKKAKQGEIFIFHLKPERKILGLFSRKDRHMLHFRNGELINEGSYSPLNKDSLFTAEADLFIANKAITTADSGSNILMYFGHEIPSKGSLAYHHSQKNVQVNVRTFTQGIQNFLNDENAFDLFVLSTCNNGNPQIVSSMQPLTKILLASPQNLHLSHIDTDAILQLEQENVSVDFIAHQIGEQTFDRLVESIQTEISLFMYDMEKVGDYLPVIDSIYSQHLPKIKSLPFEDNIDCTELPAFAEIDFSKGVRGWYRASKFGRLSKKENHSGWGCRK